MKDKGYTLVELIVVVIITGIILAVSITSILVYMDKSKINADESSAVVINTYLSSLSNTNKVMELSSNDANIGTHYIFVWKDEQPKGKKMSFSGINEGVSYLFERLLENGLPSSKTGDGFVLEIKINRGSISSKCWTSFDFDENAKGINGSYSVPADDKVYCYEVTPTGFLTQKD